MKIINALKHYKSMPACLSRGGSPLWDRDIAVSALASLPSQGEIKQAMSATEFSGLWERFSEINPTEAKTIRKILEGLVESD